VDDFGALNSVLPDPEPNPTEAVPEAALQPPPKTAEGAPEDPVKVAAESTAEEPATAGSSQVA
jgi:hypothetical protein